MWLESEPLTPPRSLLITVSSSSSNPPTKPTASKFKTSSFISTDCDWNTLIQKYTAWKLMNPGENKTSQRFGRKVPFSTCRTSICCNTQPEHYITVEPVPPLKGFINIRNCKVKESWHPPLPSTSARLTETPSKCIFCLVLLLHSYVHVKWLLFKFENRLFFFPPSHLSSTLIIPSVRFFIIRFYCHHLSPRK